MTTIFLSVLSAAMLSCSTIVVGKDASATGRVLVGHNEDDTADNLIVRQGFVPARTHAAGTLLPAEKGHARVPQVAETLPFHWLEVKLTDKGGPSVADCFLNGKGVWVVSDNAKAASPEVERGTLTDGGICYNLRRAVAERATTARDGVRIARELVETWGYSLPGRIYIFADKDEGWVVQVAKGRRLIARKCPDDAAVVIPNCYVFGRPEQGDVMSSEVKALAARDPAFDFARHFQGEQNWRLPADTFRWKYMSLALGLKGEFVFSAKPPRKLVAADLRNALSTHYEGTSDEVKPHHGYAREDKRRMLAVCRDSTVASMTCTFGATVAETALSIALGSPCRTPSAACRPFAGQLPPDCAVGEEASARLERHFRPGL